MINTGKEWRWMDDKQEEWDEDHALDLVLNDIVKDLEEE